MSSHKQHSTKDIVYALLLKDMDALLGRMEETGKRQEAIESTRGGGNKATKVLALALKKILLNQCSMKEGTTKNSVSIEKLVASVRVLYVSIFALLFFLFFQS